MPAPKQDVSSELKSIKGSVIKNVHANEAPDTTAGELVLKTTVPLALKIIFFACVGVLAIITVIQILVGATSWIQVNFIAIIAMPVIFIFLTNTKVLFLVEGIQMYGRILWWDDITDLKIDQKNRRIYLETKDGFIRILRVRAKEDVEIYQKVSDFSRRMLTMAAARAVASDKH